MTDYADSLNAHLLVDYVSGGMTIAAACRLIGITRRQDVYEAMEGSEQFRGMMEKARADGYDAIAEDCMTIADDGTNDFVETEDRFGNPKIALDKEHIQRSKLRVDTRLRLLAKWHPKKYGEKLEIEQRSATIAIPVTDDPVVAQRAYEDLMKPRG